MKCCNRNTPRVLEVGCCDAPTLFHKVTIPASIGDETTMPPRNGAYRNALVEYDASGEVYFYSSDGIPTHISGDLDKLKELIEKSVAEEAAARDTADKKLAKDIEDEALTRAEAITELANRLLDETNARKDGDRVLDGKIESETRARGLADNEIWAEINLLEIASDVVDIVGTYAALQAYDTSKLQDNDIVKVLRDETHSNATTYYRWNKTASQFAYIGEEGPYYTTSQTDTLLAGKQDALTAGNNIQISDNVISATDTTYTAGTNVQINGTVISATDTTYTAGTGISIDTNNVISSTASTTLYSATGQNTDGAMTQKAATDMVFEPGYDPTTAGAQSRILIGTERQHHTNSQRTIGLGRNIAFWTSATVSGGDSISIGHYSGSSDYCVAIGNNSSASHNESVAIGRSSNAQGDGSVALGSGSYVDDDYVVSVGSGDVDDSATYQYRKIVNVADATAAHDAVTKGQMDTAIAGVTSNNINSSDWNALWQ